jgi:hypothetical protein
MPPTPNGWHGPREVQRLFVPLLDGRGIDLMMCGHTAGKYFEPEPGRDFPYLINNKLHRAVIEADRSGVTLQTSDCQGKNWLNIQLRAKSSK